MDAEHLLQRPEGRGRSILRDQERRIDRPVASCNVTIKSSGAAPSSQHLRAGPPGFDVGHMRWRQTVGAWRKPFTVRMRRPRQDETEIPLRTKADPVCGGAGRSPRAKCWSPATSKSKTMCPDAFAWP